jgi:hypothetical protein
MPEPLELDHLLYATPDVDATVHDLERRFGTAFTGGGRHPGWGTRNRILPLKGRRYLEVIGPDEADPASAGRRLLDVDELDGPRMAWWAVRPFLMPLTCGELEAAGIVPGDVIEGRREVDGGGELVWQMTDPRVRLEGGIVPLVIDWEGAAHPGAPDSPVTLVDLRLEHPDAARLNTAFGQVGLPTVHPGEAPGITATFDTPQGTVVLR